MNDSSLCAVFARHGQPLDVLRLEEQPVRPPQRGEIIVRLLRASINPADLNVLEGSYARLPPLPATPGMEGMGEIAEIGAGVDGWKVGQQVFLPLGQGHWREYWTGPVAECLRVPPGLTLEAAASLRVNPATAWRMLHDFFPLQAGEWVLQNAGNSAVGRCIIQIARHVGWRTVSLVRRPELIAELEALGADLVLLDDAEAARTIQERTGGASIRLALNSIGGESASRLLSALGEGGKLVTFGGMSRQPVKVSTGPLIFEDISLHGFWVTRWYLRAALEQRQALLDELGLLSRAGLLQPQVDAIFPLRDLLAAIQRAQESGRRGKVLLRLN